jgi:hypothetical protein
LRIAHEQRGLARRDQSLRSVGAKSRARLIEVKGAEQTPMEVAVLAAAPVLSAALRGAFLAEPERLGDPRCLFHLDHVGDQSTADHGLQEVFSQRPCFRVTGSSRVSGVCGFRRPRRVR